MEGHFLHCVALLRAGLCRCQRREMTVSTNNGLVNVPVHNLLMQFFTLGSSKIKVFETCYYVIVTTQYDHPWYVKHVLGRIYMFFTLFGYWSHGGGGGGGSPGIGTQPAYAVFTPDSSKIKIFETYFFDIVITKNDHPKYVKHVLVRVYMFFTLFGYWAAGGWGSQGIGTQPAYAVFHPGRLKIEVLETFFFDIVITKNDHARYVKHVLGRVYMFFTLFGYWAGGGGGGWGGLPRDWCATCLCSFSPLAAQKSKFLKLIFLML